jgi:hypothetical protein
MGLVSGRVRYLSLRHNVQTGPVSNPASNPVYHGDLGGLFLEVKRAGREDNDLRPSSIRFGISKMYRHAACILNHDVIHFIRATLSFGCKVRRREPLYMNTTAASRDTSIRARHWSLFWSGRTLSTHSHTI